MQKILHEIAHALVGKGHHHDPVWRAKAREAVFGHQEWLTAKHKGLSKVCIQSVKPELRAEPVDPAYGRADQQEVAGPTLNTAEFRQYLPKLLARFFCGLCALLRLKILILCIKFLLEYGR